MKSVLYNEKKNLCLSGFNIFQTGPIVSKKAMCHETYKDDRIDANSKEAQWFIKVLGI
jgi:hypothetical protein